MKAILIIDDEKRWKDIFSDCTVLGDEIQNGKTFVFYARKIHDAYFYLETYKGLFSEVFIDYELGQGDTGMDILEWLEKNPDLIPKVMTPCSNHSGNAQKMWEKIQELKVTAANLKGE